MRMGVVKARFNMPGSFLAATETSVNKPDQFIRHSLAGKAPCANGNGKDIHENIQAYRRPGHSMTGWINDFKK